MNFEYDYPLYRPPSEAMSLIIQVTLGCSHNKCTFCSMYKSKRFRMRKIEDIKKDIDFLRGNIRYIDRIFLADGDALIVPFKFLKEVIEYINLKFPEVERISIYASPKSIQLKSDEELKELYNLGLKFIYLGIESGSDKVLKDIKKGVSREELIECGKKIKKSGISLSVTVVAGLGGKKDTIIHGKETGDIISQINPDYFGILSLMIEEGTELYEDYCKNKFSPLSNREILEEIKSIIEHIHVKDRCIFRSNHASNYISLKGTLLEDKENIIKNIENALKNNEFKDEYMRRL